MPHPKHLTPTLTSSGKRQEVHIPGRAVGAALLELHRETVGLLHSKEDLLALGFT